MIELLKDGEWVDQYKELLSQKPYTRDLIGSLTPYIRDGDYTQLIQIYKQLLITGNLSVKNNFTTYLLQTVGLAKLKEVYPQLTEEVFDKLQVVGTTFYWEEQLQYTCLKILIQPWENPSFLVETEVRLFYEWVSLITDKLCGFEELRKYEFDNEGTLLKPWTEVLEVGETEEEEWDF